MMNNSPKRIGLIIQGPMMSVGRHGLTAGMKPQEVSNQHIVQFDCHETVRHLISSYGDVFARIVLVTWKGEVKAAIEGADVLEVLDTTRALKFRDGVPNEVVAVNNKLRQMYLIRVGLNHLAERGQLDGVLKVRTDQELDLEEAVTRLSKELESEAPRMLVSRTFPSGRFQDFYFGTSLDQMSDFVESYLRNYVEFHESIHDDIPLRVAYNSKYLKLRRPLWWFFHDMGHKEILATFSRRYLAPFSQKLLQNLKWRGTRYEDLNKLAFYDGDETHYNWLRNVAGPPYEVGRFTAAHLSNLTCATICGMKFGKYRAVNKDLARTK